MIKIKYDSHGYENINDAFIFNGGEIHVQLEQYLPQKVVEIKAELHNSEDVMQLLMVKDVIDRQYPTAQKRLYMPYIPYARQDRVCNAGEAFSLKVFANLINNMHFDDVIVVDPHSDVAPALINNCHIITQGDILAKFISYKEDWNITDKLSKGEITLVSPDAGAEKKVLKVAQQYGGLQIINASKVRDTKTGKITHTHVPEYQCRDQDLLIVDDICDGGMTFIKLAEELQKWHPRSINLYVTHGIFSKGYQPLFSAGIRRIFTTDSFEQMYEVKGLRVISI